MRIHKAVRFLCGMLTVALLCSACGRKVPPPEAASVPPPPASDGFEPDASPPPEPPGPEERSTSLVIPLELPEGEVPAGTIVPYTWDYSVTVDNGRQLTLRLRCEAERQSYDAWYYGVRSIDVLDGDTLRQTLSIQLADAASQFEWGGDPDWAMEKTSPWHEDGGLIIEDLNFDGIPDLRLEAANGVVNTQYLCWLWRTDFQRFQYFFSLCGYDVRIDPEKQQLITEDRDASTYTTKYYQYDEDGSLYLADSSSVTY